MLTGTFNLQAVRDGEPASYVDITAMPDALAMTADNVQKVPVLLESKVKKVSDGAVTVETADGKTKEIKADSVIVSVGYVPAPLAEKSAHVHIVGDAEKVGNLRTVVWKAWEVAEKL